MSDEEWDEPTTAKPPAGGDDDDSDDWDKSDDEQNAWKAGADDDDDWDEDTTKPPPEEEVAAETAAAPAAASESASKASAGASSTGSHRQRAGDEIYVALDDPKAEKARRLKMQMEADGRLADDLFDGFLADDGKERDALSAGEHTPAAKSTSSAVSPSKAAASAAKSPLKGGAKATAGGSSPSKLKAAKKAADVTDLWDEFKLDTQQQCTLLMKEAMEKLAKVENKSHMKGAVNQFLSKLLHAVGENLTLKEVQDMEKKVKEIIRVKKVETTQAQAAKTKINAVHKHMKVDVAGALDEMYNNDDDWDEDEWDGDWGEGDWSQGDWSQGQWK
ncbi:unnamed protein product [Amoebophrya sp. A25]|nr:unnamed protein product [Amoebophrya sp. A25]|eukprot:GSA25T00000040001.1